MIEGLATPLTPSPGTIAARAKELHPNARAIRILDARARRIGLSLDEFPETVVRSMHGKGWVYRSRHDCTTFGTIGPLLPKLARAVERARERKESQDRDALARASFPNLAWGKGSPGYLRTLPSESAFARFLGEAKEVGKIAQAYGHSVTVYRSKGKLVRVSQASNYGYKRTVHEVNPGDFIAGQLTLKD